MIPGYSCRGTAVLPGGAGVWPHRVAIAGGAQAARGNRAVDQDTAAAASVLVIGYLGPLAAAKMILLPINLPRIRRMFRRSWSCPGFLCGQDAAEPGNHVEQAGVEAVEDIVRQVSEQLAGESAMIVARLREAGDVIDLDYPLSCRRRGTGRPQAPQVRRPVSERLRWPRLVGKPD